MRVAVVAFALGVPAAALSQAQTVRRENVQILSSRSIPRDVADTVARVFNDSGTVRLTGSQTIEAGRHVPSDVGVIEGTLEINGHVTGRVVAINAVVVVQPLARLDGEVTILGGRLDAREGSVVAGDVRVYRDHLQIEHDAGGIVVHEESPQGSAYRRPDSRPPRSWSGVRFLSARTYNRVEGLPILAGPAISRELRWGRLTIDALGILRSADQFQWKSENVGHTLRAEVSVGRNVGVRAGGRLFDVVDAVEPWHLSDSEVGLASFFLHRDFRDYFDRHGAALYGGLFVGGRADITLSYSDQRWGARSARTPLTVFRREEDWRPNPQLDEGLFHILNATLHYDTRNDQSNPWSGWYLLADYEYGVGAISRYGPSSLFMRRVNADGRSIYDRAFVDLRRYNRVSPEGQLNFRLVLGGWLSGDQLPLERRLSVGGPGTLPGYDFRRIEGRTDYWQCAGPLTQQTGGLPQSPAGLPAQCERIALGQIEYRGEIHVDPFGLFNEERERGRRGWGRRAEWVVFADAGRGWLVGDRHRGDLTYGRLELPPLSTLRTDAGIGLRFDEIGLYAAKAVSQVRTPVNFFVRLRPRF